ncbi:MAG: S8 family serine peptidase, partial [Ignavibacterium sp.]|nr:S8 family serine peptidase [Ignavibacterium sp.]
MKHISILFLLVLLFLSHFSIAQEERFVPGQIMVQLSANDKISNVTESFSAIGLEAKQLLSEHMNIWLLGYDQTKISDDDILFTVRLHPEVKIVQFNHYVQLREAVEEKIKSLEAWFKLNNDAMPNDPRFNEQWALQNTGQSGGVPGADIKAVSAWDLATGGVTATGDTIVLAIVDNGFDLNHVDLYFWKNWAEIPGNGIDDDGNGYIDDFNGWNAYNNNGNITSSQHGTHVSGIAAARGNNAVGVSGVNWNTQIMPIQGSSGTESTVIVAYNYVLKARKLYNQTNGAQGAFVVATNASFGVDYGNPANFPLWCAMYDSLGVQGILSMGATANANINVDIQGDIPTACPSDWLISITNTTSSDLKNSGAAYGLTTIDLGAPGTSVLNTVPGGGYSSLTGTSMATPHVTGAVGLMFSAAQQSIMESYKANPGTGALLFKQLLLDATDPIPALQGITVTGGRLNLYNALISVFTSPDTIPPNAIIDLSVSEPTSNSLELSWTVPLDTSRNGVVAYDIRFSTLPITDSISFYSADQINFPDVPDSTGAAETLTILELDFATTYYFAIKSFDMWGNKSDLSNPASGTTWAAPQIDVDPLSISHILFPQTTYTDTITISNITAVPSTLDFSVSLENNTFPEGLIEAKFVPQSSTPEEAIGGIDKNNQPEVYGVSLEGQGGPDPFGYSWIDSNEPNGPQYVWDDIVSTGTLATNWVATGTFDPKDEGYAGPFPLGFNFNFYGNPKTQVYVSSNGLLLFNTISSNIFTNAAIPNTNVPNEYIAPFWDDLDGRTQGTVHYKQDGNKFIVQFTNWQKYSATGSLTFQIVLYSNGRIMFYYNNMNATLNSATVGIEDAAGTVGLQVAYNATYVTNGLAVKISADPEWLAGDITGGTIYNGNAVDLVLTFNSEDYPLGDYSMDVVISSNDPVNSTVTVPVTMNLQEIPVELSSLRAAADKNNVVVNWTTATETNNS